MDDTEPENPSSEGDNAIESTIAWILAHQHPLPPGETTRDLVADGRRDRDSPRLTLRGLRNSRQLKAWLLEGRSIEIYDRTELIGRIEPMGQHRAEL